MIKQLVLKGMRWLAVAWAACLAFSCLLPESQRMPEVLELTLSDDNPSALATSIDVNVKCDLHWTLELEDSSWGSVTTTLVSEGSGGTCTVNLGVNKADDARENTLILKAGKGELRKTITQQGMADFFNPEQVILAGVQETALSFPAPSAWTAAAQEDWIVLSTTSGEKGWARLNVSARDLNKNLGDREGKITFTIDGNDYDVPVAQRQTDVILSDDTDVSFAYEGGEFTVTTRYNVEYEIEVSDSWVTHVGTKAPLNQSTETFSVAQNESPEARTATVSFSGADAGTLVITVSQEGKDPVLNIIQPGFYGINGVDYVMDTDGWNQSSIYGYSTGQIRYRLFQPETLTVAELSGMKMLPLLNEGDAINLKFKLVSKGYTLLNQDYTGVLLRAKDDTAWIKVDDTTYFILLAL